jgi:SET family sugar efflux transporter-like MFS transporter
VTALAIGTVLYVVYLTLLGLCLGALACLCPDAAQRLWRCRPDQHPDHLSPGSDRRAPGLGSALISVNLFLSGGLSAILFAIGTRFSDYSGTSMLGALAGMCGLGLLLFFERRKRR